MQEEKWKQSRAFRALFMDLYWIFHRAAKCNHSFEATCWVSSDAGNLITLFCHDETCMLHALHCELNVWKMFIIMLSHHIPTLEQNKFRFKHPQTWHAGTLNRIMSMPVTTYCELEACKLHSTPLQLTFGRWKNPQTISICFLLLHMHQKWFWFTGLPSAQQRTRYTAKV